MSEQPELPFTNGSLRKSIEETLNTPTVIPPGKNGAFVIHYDDFGIRTAIAAKINNVWEIQGQIGWHPNSDGLSIGTNVMAVW